MISSCAYASNPARKMTSPASPFIHSLPIQSVAELYLDGGGRGVGGGEPRFVAAGRPGGGEAAERRRHEGGGENEKSLLTAQDFVDLSEDGRRERVAQ